MRNMGVHSTTGLGGRVGVALGNLLHSHLCGCSGLRVSLSADEELFLLDEESGVFCMGTVDRSATPGGS